MFDKIQKLRTALIAPALIILGAFFMYTGFEEAKTAKALADHGKRVLAQVVSVEEKATGTNTNDNDLKVGIRFTTEDQQTITATVGVLAAQSRTLRDSVRDKKTDATLDITYLPENPRKLVLAHYTDHSMITFIVATLTLLAGIGVFVANRLNKRNTAAA